MSKIQKAPVARIAAGFVLLGAGGILALPLVPGPGIPLVLLGLMLLSSHFAWARNALAWTQHKLSGARRIFPK
jgi:Putative transmembrane protein (PGPGW)